MRLCGVMVMQSVGVSMLAAVAVVPAFAAPPQFNKPDTVRLTLPQAIERAVANYPSIKARQAAQLRAAKELDATRAEYLPEAAITSYANFGTNNSVAGTFYPYNSPVQGGIRPDGIYTPVFGSYAALELSWQAFTFGKAESRIAAAQTEQERAEAEYRNELFRQQIAVADAYMLAVMSERLVRVQESNLRRSEIFYTISQSKAASGLVSGVDSALAAAERSKSLLLLLESRKNAELQRAKLAELVGLPFGSVVMADTMSLFAAVPRDRERSPDSANAAIDQTPPLLLARKTADVSQARAEAIGRSWLPSLRLWGSVFGKGSGVQNSDNSYRSDFASGMAFQALNYTMAVSLRFDLFDFFRTSERAAAEQARSQELRYEYDTKRLEAERRYEYAAQQLRLAITQAQESPVQFAAASASYSQANARYQAGLAPLTELVQSYYILSRADADVAVAYSNAWRALLLKAASVGDVGLVLNQLK
jgi:outer membrane protein TolC